MSNEDLQYQEPNKYKRRHMEILARRMSLLERLQSGVVVCFAGPLIFTTFMAALYLLFRGFDIYLGEGLILEENLSLVTRILYILGSAALMWLGYKIIRFCDRHWSQMWSGIRETGSQTSRFKGNNESLR